MTEGVMRDGVLRNGREECRKSHTVSPMADGSIAFTDVESRQVKKLQESGNVVVIGGTGEESNKNAFFNLLQMHC